MNTTERLTMVQPTSYVYTCYDKKCWDTLTEMMAEQGVDVVSGDYNGRRRGNCVACGSKRTATYRQGLRPQA